jgi:hypothetical protein
VQKDLEKMSVAQVRMRLHLHTSCGRMHAWLHGCVRASERVSAPYAGGGCAGRVEKISLKPVDSLFAPPSAATSGTAARTHRSSASACRRPCTWCGLGYAAAAPVGSCASPQQISVSICHAVRTVRETGRQRERKADRGQRWWGGEGEVLLAIKK